MGQAVVKAVAVEASCGLPSLLRAHELVKTRRVLPRAPACCAMEVSGRNFQRCLERQPFCLTRCPSPPALSRAA